MWKFNFQLSHWKMKHTISYLYLFTKYEYSFKKCIYFTSWLQFSLPSLLPVSPCISLLLPPQFNLFRKGQASQGYQRSMAYQVVVRISTCPCSKVGQGDPVEKVGGQSPAEEAETAPTVNILMGEMI